MKRVKQTTESTTTMLPERFYVEHVNEADRVRKATPHLNTATLIECPSRCGQQHFANAIPVQCYRTHTKSKRPPRNPNQYNGG